MTRSSRDNLQMQRQWTQDADPSQPVSVGQYGRGRGILGEGGGMVYRAVKRGTGNDREA